MPCAAVNALRLYYEEEGTGRTLVLLNAATGPLDSPGHSSWAALRPYLALSYHVVQFKQSGHGRTALGSGVAGGLGGVPALLPPGVSMTRPDARIHCHRRQPNQTWTSKALQNAGLRRNWASSPPRLSASFSRRFRS